MLVRDDDEKLRFTTNPIMKQHLLEWILKDGSNLDFALQQLVFDESRKDYDYEMALGQA